MKWNLTFDQKHYIVIMRTIINRKRMSTYYFIKFTFDNSSDWSSYYLEARKLQYKDALFIKIVMEKIEPRNKFSILNLKEIEHYGNPGYMYL